MDNTLKNSAFGLIALAIAGCGAPETECRDGVKDLKKRSDSFVGFNQPDEVKKAFEAINTAETQLATGNYKGCVESLGEARALLNRAQRTNQ